MKKVQNIIGIILFFALIAMTGVSAVFFGGGNLSDMLSDKTSAEKYICKNFPFAENFKTLYSKTASILGQRVFSSEDGGEIVYDKENNRLIYSSDSYDGEKSKEYVKSINSLYEQSSDIPTYVMLVPTASGIMRGDVKPLSSSADQQKLIDELYYEIDEDIVPLDVFNALYSSRDDYIYFRTDDRWTQQGAYEAYAASAAKMGLSVYSISNYDIDYTHVTFSGSLASQTGIRDTLPDTINVCRCKYGSYVKSAEIIKDKQVYTKTSIYTRSGLQDSDKYSYFFGDAEFKCARITTASEDSPKLLVVGSDYASCFVPFLAPHYSQITLVCPENLEDKETLSEFANLKDYDRILFLFDADTFCTGNGADKLK